jgi:hypothetical protein
MVSLRPNTGGIALKEAASEPFDVTGTMPASYGIPGLWGSTVEILDGIAPPIAEDAARKTREMLETGSADAAASVLGSAFRRVSGTSQLRALAKYVDALFASGESVDSIARFAVSFTAGYDGCGVLILSKSGVKSWSAALSDDVSITGDRYVVIPFETGKDFVLNLEGSGEGDTSLWKVVPQGVNKKDYPQGDWDKEIAVHTGRLTP